ncbi:MAG: DUF420 domain-containing protein [Planctomycetes bacterium]|nr:DUF420 domain-containing protein [Planctomycetota bacterium]
MSRFLALVLALLTTLPLCAQDAKKDPAQEEKIFQPYDHPLGPFKLRERNGKFVQDRDLVGKIWVAQFFYPMCNLCSRNTPTMKKLQDHYRGAADIRLVSIDLNDSAKTWGNPKILHEFADDHEAEPGQWLFLTGPAEAVHDVVRLSFFNMALKKENPALGDTISHSTYLVLVDPKGQIVGYVDGTNDKAFDALRVQIDRLRAQRRLDERIPVTGADMPRFNAMLNSICTILLLAGWIAIRMRFETVHKIIMLLALAVSMVFLASYLFYHFVVIEAEPTRFRGEGPVRFVYYAILLSHTILAIAVAPLAIFITIKGLRNELEGHAKVARWTLPIWLYVSVTGVVVYWMLYRVEW